MSVISAISSILSPSQTAPAKNTTAATNTNSSSSPTSLGGGLDANSFITLLAAQLQAQDPLNPMDPNQMVDELTSMNTLQQTIQIRQDLDTLAGNLPATSTAGGSGTTNPVSGTSQATGASVGAAPGAGQTSAATMKASSIRALAAAQAQAAAANLFLQSKIQ
jgi:flagellar basal-body rod modification protein FlgD